MHDHAALRRLAPALLLAVLACGQDPVTGVPANDAVSEAAALSPAAAELMLSLGGDASLLTFDMTTDAVTDLRDRVTLSTSRTFKRNAEQKLNQLLDALNAADWTGARAALNNVRTMVDGTTDTSITAELDVFRVALAQVEIFLLNK